MKLHLPKALFAAIAACAVVASPVWAASNATSSSTADGVTTRWYGTEAGSTVNSVDLSGLNATTDKVVLNMTGGYFSDGSWTCAAAVEVKNLTINNGYSDHESGGKTYTFTGTVTGTGNFSFTSTNVTDQHYVFSGDMSGYTGAMSLATGSYDGRSFTFNGITVGASSINVGSTGGNYVDVNGSTIKGDLTANKLNIGVSGNKTVSTFEGTTTAGTITMGAGVSTIVNSGTFTATTVNINDLSGLTVDTTAPSTYSENGNGYKATTCKLVTNEGEGTVNIGTVNVLGAAAALSADNTAFTTSATSGAYYVNNGTIDYGMEGTSIYSDNTTGIVLSGGNLNMTQSLLTAAKAAGIHVDNTEGTTTIALGEGVTLDKTNLTAATATVLTGSGTYNITGNLALGDNVSTSAEDWSGTIRITNATINNTATNNIGKLNSYGKVEISGLSGYLYENAASSGDSWNTRITADIVMLEGNAITLNSGSSQTSPSVRNHEFSGTISGTGDFAITANTVSSNVFKFSGDTSKWTGAFSLNFANQKSATTHPVTLEFSGVSNIGTSVSLAAGNTLKLIISGDAADGVTFKSINGTMPTAGTMLLETSGTLEKVFTNAVVAKTATLEGGAVTFNNALTLTDASTLGTDVDLKSTLTLSQDKALTISEGKTMKVGGITFKANDGGATITRTAENSGAFSAGSDDFSITGLAVIGSTSNITTQLKNVDLVNENGYTKLNNSGSSYKNISITRGSVGVLANTEVTGNVAVGGQGLYMDGKGTLSVGGTVTVASGAEMTTEANSSVAKVGEAGGNVTISDGGILQLKAKDTGALNIAGTLTLSNGAKLKLNNTALQITVSDEQQSFVLANVGSLSVGSITLEGLNIGDRAWALQDASGNNLLTGGTEGTITSGAPLSSAATDALKLVVAGAASTPIVPTTLTATAVSGTLVTGTVADPGTLTLKLDKNAADLATATTLNISFQDETLWSTITAGKDMGGYVTIALVGADNVALDLTNVNVGFYGYTGVEGQPGTYFVGYIPEPATATLGLLALAALATRRRRK